MAVDDSGLGFGGGEPVTGVALTYRNLECTQNTYTGRKQCHCSLPQSLLQSLEMKITRLVVEDTDFAP